MAWTAPKTWAAGDIVTAADMNTYVRDNTDYIGNDAMRRFTGFCSPSLMQYAIEQFFSGAEQNMATISVFNPGFPGNFVYVPYGTWVINNFTANSDATDILYRDNAVGGTVVGRFHHRMPAIGNQRATLGGLGTVSPPVSSTRTVFFNCTTGANGCTINYASLTTFLGALVAPI